MISVLNRLRRSSGSNLLWLAALVLMAACSSQRGLKDSGTTDSDLPKVYNPRTGLYEPVADPTALIDTVKWEEKKNVPDPITAPVEVSDKKDVYSVAFLLPLSAEGKTLGNRIDAKTRRFLNYYGGIQFALQDLEAEGIRIEATVLDTKEDETEVANQLEQLKDMDLIIGPYDRSCLQTAASYAARYQVPVVSPWTPSIAPATSSEYFVQAVPGLQSHAEAAMRYAAINFDSAKFFLVANPSTSEHTRMQTYLDAFDKYMHDSMRLEKLVVDDIALGPDSNDLTTIYYPELTNVFVMPYYLRSEQEFVNSFLRKIHAEHGETEVVVIGLPQWMQFNDVNPDYLEGLNAHITAVQFVDNSKAEVRNFNERYFAKYRGVPEQAAWQGYQLTRYLGRTLNEYGTGFLTELPDLEDSSREFDFKQVYESGSGTETKGVVRFIENRGIAILVFKEQQFQRVE